MNTPTPSRLAGELPSTRLPQRAQSIRVGALAVWLVSGIAGLANATGECTAQPCVDASHFASLAATCAPAVHVQTAAALVHVESAFNPWAIGVVGGSLLRQPRSRGEALATARALQSAGWDFSIGLGQINVRNLKRLGLTLETGFEPCINLGAMQEVLSDCFTRAYTSGTRSKQQALRPALSCYYSGNFVTGFKHGYVDRVVAAATQQLVPSSSGNPANFRKENP